ncbi:hypothetical protein BDV27DRAFT_131994 [Aspergillus caelatus]|uniref:Uncharacterized protein n=2 Tax=Aspergillus subgen. Circumdati TaxID=2720871 RepID=A0A5N6ZYX4_9EURO|nr:uncharacterized protein BDV27DRAFT_131994 [Aspergillus caelatus]KAE8362139.1 hypothetical protein BDV27DRAFT_131994 [Aspergillus caelatus]
MGIPMYREPSSTEAAKNNPVKDPCAAARSAIRRQTTIRRPSRYSSSALRSATLRSPFPRPLANEIEREANGLSRHVRSPIPNSGSGEDPFDLTNGLSDSSAREAGQRLLNDVLRHSRPGQRLRIPRNTVLDDIYLRAAAGDHGGARQEQDHPPPSFTPRFAPAIAYHRTASPQAPPDVRLAPFPRSEAFGGDASIGSTIPLLRRVGQRSINQQSRSNSQTVVDGLGDRQRSVSPDGDNANDAWETLLTTITPDTNLPSADSSFTSASAGTNASMNGTARSSATSFGTLPNSMDSTAATVQMVLDPYPEFLNPCDYSTSTDSDSDSEAEATQNSLFHYHYRRIREINARRDARRRARNAHSTMSSQPPLPAISLAISNSIDPDLQHMQAILDRLARREDVPDDLWTAAGLSRTIGQGVSANDGTSNSDAVDGPSRQQQ